MLFPCCSLVNKRSATAHSTFSSVSAKISIQHCCVFLCFPFLHIRSTEGHCVVSDAVWGGLWGTRDGGDIKGLGGMQRTNGFVTWH